MRNEYQDFNQTLEKLKHSFIKELKYHSKTEIDFQHPSIRDLLLNYLQEDPQIRLLYIKRTSVFGITDIIEGLPQYGTETSNLSHKLIINAPKELEALNNRLREIINDNIPLDDLKKIFFTINSLLPKKDNKIISCYNANLKDFNKTESAGLIRTFLNTISKRGFYLSKKNYKSDDWNFILSIFYEISPYIFPINKIEYLFDLVDMMTTKTYLEYTIEFYNLIYVYERTIFEHTFSKTIDDSLYDLILYKIEILSTEISQFLEEDALETNEAILECNDCKQKTDEFIQLGSEYFSFSEHQEPEDLNNLIEIRNCIVVPTDVEPDDDYDWDNNEDDTEYWTIERLFEDL